MIPVRCDGRVRRADLSAVRRGQTERTGHAIVLIEQGAAGGAPFHASGLIHDAPQVRGVAAPERLRYRLEADRLPEPARELLRLEARMVHGVAALNHTAGRIEAGEVHIVDDRIFVEPDQPEVFLLDYRDRARLLCAVAVEQS